MGEKRQGPRGFCGKLGTYIYIYIPMTDSHGSMVYGSLHEKLALYGFHVGKYTSLMMDPSWDIDHPAV